MSTVSVGITYKYRNEDRPRIVVEVPEAEPYAFEFSLLEQIMMKEQPGLKSLGDLLNVNPIGAVNTLDEAPMAVRVLAECLEVDLVRYEGHSQVQDGWAT